ncbi:34399_t:CDS:1, partial [Gigaspora margarita]
INNIEINTKQSKLIILFSENKKLADEEIKFGTKSEEKNLKTSPDI